MRTSLLALVLLVVAAALGYAYSNDRLPASFRAPIEQAMNWGRDLVAGRDPFFGKDEPAPVQQAAAPSPAKPAASQGDRNGRRLPGAFPVEVATALSTPSESAIRSVGSLASDESVSISAEVGGRIAEIRFREGDRVKEGDVLVKLDDSLIRAELADAQARLTLADGNFRRANTLSQSGAGTERALDEARSAQGTARAAVDLAQTRLSKTEIRAPFGGIVGLRKVSAGAYVDTGQAMVNLEKIDVLKLDFKVPENLLAQVHVGQPVQISVDAYPEKLFTGEIYAIDPMVDVNGRALSARARLDNREEVLRPGLFARVMIRRAVGERVVIVPEGAIVPRADGVVVFRVQDGKAVETPVQLGERRAGAVEIVSGVQPQDVVIVSGHTRLKNGAQVEVVQTSPSGSAG